MRGHREREKISVDQLDYDAELDQWLLVKTETAGRLFLIGIVRGDRKGRFRDGALIHINPADALGVSLVRDDRQEERWTSHDRASQSFKRRPIEKVGCERQRSVGIAGLGGGVLRMRIAQRHRRVNQDVREIRRPREAGWKRRHPSRSTQASHPGRSKKLSDFVWDRLPGLGVITCNNILLRPSSRDGTACPHCPASHGNSTGMIVPKAILAAMGAREGESLDVSVENGRLIAPRPGELVEEVTISAREEVELRALASKLKTAAERMSVRVEEARGRARFARPGARSGAERPVRARTGRLRRRDARSARSVSTIGDILSGLRQSMLMEHRLGMLVRDVEALTAAHAETRERVIRLEVVIDEARGSRDARGLPES